MSDNKIPNKSNYPQKQPTHVKPETSKACKPCPSRRANRAQNINQDDLPDVSHADELKDKKPNLKGSSSNTELNTKEGVQTFARASKKCGTALEALARDQTCANWEAAEEVCSKEATQVWDAITAFCETEPSEEAMKTFIENKIKDSLADPKDFPNLPAEDVASYNIFTLLFLMSKNNQDRWKLNQTASETSIQSIIAGIKQQMDAVTSQAVLGLITNIVSAAITVASTIYTLKQTYTATKSATDHLRNNPNSGTNQLSKKQDSSTHIQDQLNKDKTQQQEQINVSKSTNDRLTKLNAEKQKLDTEIKDLNTIQNPTTTNQNPNQTNTGNIQNNGAGAGNDNTIVLTTSKSKELQAKLQKAENEYFNLKKSSNPKIDPKLIDLENQKNNVDAKINQMETSDFKTNDDQPEIDNLKLESKDLEKQIDTLKLSKQQLESKQIEVNAAKEEFENFQALKKLSPTDLDKKITDLEELKELNFLASNGDDATISAIDKQINAFKLAKADIAFDKAELDKNLLIDSKTTAANKIAADIKATEARQEGHKKLEDKFNAANQKLEEAKLKLKDSENQLVHLESEDKLKPGSKKSEIAKQTEQIRQDNDAVFNAEQEMRSERAQLNAYDRDTLQQDRIKAQTELETDPTNVELQKQYTELEKLKENSVANQATITQLEADIKTNQANTPASKLAQHKADLDAEKKTLELAKIEKNPQKIKTSEEKIASLEKEISENKQEIFEKATTALSKFDEQNENYNVHSLEAIVGTVLGKKGLFGIFGDNYSKDEQKVMIQTYKSNMAEFDFMMQRVQLKTQIYQGVSQLLSKGLEGGGELLKSWQKTEELKGQEAAQIAGLLYSKQAEERGQATQNFMQFIQMVQQIMSMLAQTVSSSARNINT